MPALTHTQYRTSRTWRIHGVPRPAKRRLLTVAGTYTRGVPFKNKSNKKHDTYDTYFNNRDEYFASKLYFRSRFTRFKAQAVCIERRCPHPVCIREPEPRSEQRAAIRLQRHARGSLHRVRRETSQPRFKKSPLGGSGYPGYPLGTVPGMLKRGYNTSLGFLFTCGCDVVHTITS